jgi:hypothetical protein
MDYELLFTQYEELADKFKAQLSQQQRLFKRVNKSMALGNLRDAGKDIAALALFCEESLASNAQMADLIDEVDAADYLASGDFSEQLVKQCGERGIDIVGEEGTYEIFPYRLKVNPSEEEILINGKKAPGLRPATIADVLEQGRSRLLAANFNATQFAGELAAAYDLAIIAAAKGKKPVLDADVYLNNLYKYLTPMRRFRKDYDVRSFAFDLARLYDAEAVSAPDGRGIQFGPSRNNNRAIRILDAFGNELFIATVRFYKV